MQRIDPQHDFAVSVFCTLLSADATDVAGIGVDARFGPPGSPFAGTRHASTTLNNTLYVITPDGHSRPFVRLDPESPGGPLYLRFAPDGQSLLVTGVRGGIFAARGSAILRILGDGRVVGKAVAEAPTMFGSLDCAPPGLGKYVGRIFVVEVGSYEMPVPASQPLRADGKRELSDGSIVAVTADE